MTFPALATGCMFPPTCYRLDSFARYTFFVLYRFKTDIFLLRHSDLSYLFSGPAVEYDGQTCQGVPSAPPMLGQHTTEILTDMLQYSDKEIYNLERDGVIESYPKN